MTYEDLVKKYFKSINSISTRKGFIEVSIRGRGVDTFQFADAAAMEADELGQFIISKMTKENLKKAGVEND